jgi:hyperosmotically inducible protein
MTTDHFPPLGRMTALTAIVAAAVLGACDRSEDSRTAGQRLDAAVAKVEQKSDEAQAKMRQDTAEFKADAKQAGAELKADAKQAGAEAKSAIGDASITASINAELAKDKELSALRINVDTVNGRVALHGTAPTDSARERATRLAMGVDGVHSVDNQLSVKNG